VTVPASAGGTDRHADPRNGRVVAERALLDVIGAAVPNLRRSEQKVARRVLDDPHRAVHSSIAELADASDVSQPTVMRFCTAIGCDGFQTFKLRLAQSLAFGIPATHSAIERTDRTHDLVEKIFDFTLSSLEHARRNLDQADIDRAVDLLAGAEEILFIGFGASGIVAQDAQQKFPLFGVPCGAPVDAHQQFIAASLAGPGTAVVAISNTGRTRSVIRCVEVARANGAPTIGISGAQTPLLAGCDVGLVVETLENTDFYTPTISRLAALVVVDILATATALRHPAGYIERLRVMKEQLTAMRTGGSGGSRLEPPDELVTRLDHGPPPGGAAAKDASS
jgi:RpiR family carbohydrate utilization transcriptional regulator